MLGQRVRARVRAPHAEFSANGLEPSIGDIYIFINKCVYEFELTDRASRTDNKKIKTPFSSYSDSDS